MDYLRQSVGLRGYAQKNPKQEYKKEAFELFNRTLDEYKTDVVSVLSKVQVRNPEQVEQAEQQARVQAQAAPAVDISYEHKDAASALSGGSADESGARPDTGGTAAVAAAAAAREAAVNRAQQPAVANTQPVRRTEPKIGRNEPCHCGSGKKFKNCHGKLS